MAKNKVAKFIQKGLSTQDIQKRIKDFPENVTTQYLESLGYSQIDAIKYKWLLRQNDRKSKERKSEESKKELFKDKALIVSKNADPNNILIDVCAFQFRKSIDIIDKSDRVIVLYSVIKEMDRVSYEQKNKECTTERNKFLLYNIRHYAFEMLLNKSKYRLVPYEKSSMSYGDDVIIEYLKTLPPKRRPTLLTADKLLALRADCLGLEFIFVAKSLDTQDVKNTSKDSEKHFENVVEEGKLLENRGNKQKEKDNKNQDRKTTNVLGAMIRILYPEEKVRINLCSIKVKVFTVKGDEFKEIEKKDELKFSHFDYILIINKMKKYKCIKVSKVKISEMGFNVETEKCEVINEIYKLDLPQTMQDEAKKILIQ